MSLLMLLGLICAAFGIYVVVVREDGAGMIHLETIKRFLYLITWSSPGTTGQIQIKDENESKLIEGETKTCGWTPTSIAQLVEAETRILKRMKKPYKGRYVNIGPVFGSQDLNIWTITMNEGATGGTPLVLLHGFGAGVGFWALNLDEISANRTVHAIDLIGFGRSSRPKFGTDPVEVERQFVTVIEEWRKKMNLNKVILLGHSFGGYLATSYSISFPKRITQLILADPWGFTELPSELIARIPWWVKTIIYIAKPFNPFSIIRAAGPYGQSLIERFRPDLIRKFSTLSQEGEDLKFAEYIYHLNAQPPSGEVGFKTIAMDYYACAKSPILQRLKELDATIPITAMYGSHSWISPIPNHVFREMRQPGSRNDVHVLQGGGHHIYSDTKEKFNEIVVNSCNMADKRQNQYTS